MRFAATGAVNTLIDLSVLNLLLLIFRVNGSGTAFALIKAVSFAAAVANSYVLNKRWVFRSEGSSLASFLAVSVIGLGVNASVSAIAFASAVRIGAPFAPAAIANGAALIGTAAVLAFNFIGYKKLVFRQAVSS